MAEHLTGFYARVCGDLCQEFAFRPHPTDVMELAAALVTLADHLDSAGALPDSPFDGESYWARNMTAVACDCLEGEELAGAAPWLRGLACGLQVSAEQALAIQRDVASDQAPGWDELFREELGGPDIRLVPPVDE